MNNADLFEAARASRRAKLAELAAQQRHYESALLRIEAEQAAVQAGLDALDEAARIVAQAEQIEDRPMRDLILADLAHGPMSLDRLADGRNRRSVSHTVRHMASRSEIENIASGGGDIYRLVDPRAAEAAQ